jgi:hypothetical protein
MTDENSYGETLEPIREEAEAIKDKKPTRSKKKSAKEQFAESTGFDVSEVEETLPEVNKEDLGLTEPVQEEELQEESSRNNVYRASKVEKAPAENRDGMQLLGVGRRRQVKRTKNTEPPRINRNTVKAFPDKDLGTVNKTTFKG